MALRDMHPEDVKAAIRKKFGTLAAFNAAHGLPKLGASEVLRGRKSKRIEDAIEAVLREAAGESMAMDRSSDAA